MCLIYPSQLNGILAIGKYLLLSIAPLLLTGGVAMAQTSSYQSTTTITKSVVPTLPPKITPPPPGTLSRTVTTESNDGVGDTTYSRKTTYGNANGMVSQRSTTMVTHPLPMRQTYKRVTTTTMTSSP